MRKRTPLPKNKQDLRSKSGKRVKKELPKKDIVTFLFTTPDGSKYRGEDGGRIKVDCNGGISCLLRDEELGKWYPVKGAKLKKIELKTVIIKPKEKK